MKFNSILKQHKLLVALCLVVFCSGLAQAQDTAGPAVGDTIDLKSFQDRTGRTLFDVMKVKGTAMLVLVDPNCGTCVDAKDTLLALRERVEKTRISYFVILIPDGSDPQKYFSFADSLKLGVESFVWNNPAAKPGALLSMTKPSHLQISDEGLIVRKWSGIPQNTSTP